MGCENGIHGRRLGYQTVYVVDDDSDLRRSLQYLLEILCVAVSPYPSGEKFLSDLDHLDPSPIILDVRMPRIDGAQVLQELARREIRWPVVVLSGNGDAEIAAKLFQLGAVDYLEKPVEAPRLLQAIDAAFVRLHDQGRLKTSSAQPRSMNIFELR